MAVAARLRSRRNVLRLAGAGVLGGAVALRSGVLDSPAPEAGNPLAAAADAAPPGGPTAAPAATPAPTPRPVPAAGRLEQALLPGTPWEARVSIAHSGQPGPTLMLLGGVHGNEPGGWLAGDELTAWQPSRGSLLVLPRANVLAIRALERTFPELGDLNRLYPGNPDGAPMARMAEAIVALARAHQVDLLIDMHESWAFYGERSQNGTAYLGQTITSGAGPASARLAESLARAVNERIPTPRDRLFYRDFTSFATNSTPGEPQPANPNDGPWNPNRGGSSLALGRHVPGLTPLLVEMGQDRQELARRIELHLLVARAALELHGMV